MNNLLVECGDYTLVILELFGEKKSVMGDSLLSSYCSNISVMHHWEFISWVETLQSKPANLSLEQFFHTGHHLYGLDLRPGGCW